MVFAIAGIKQREYMVAACLEHRCSYPRSIRNLSCQYICVFCCFHSSSWM